jgi:hypothetical protein
MSSQPRVASSSKATILISGALANKPFNGGNAWSRLSWIRGFQALGFEVLFVEQIASHDCVDDNGAPARFRDSSNRAYFTAVMRQFGLEQSSALICDGGREFAGVRLESLLARALRAEALFNMGGHLSHPELLSAPACRIYYDDDPGFTQFWYAEGNLASTIEAHDFHFTIGLNIGGRDCLIPRGGINWRHTRPPLVLTDWPSMSSEVANASHEPLRFTTVASWRGAYAPMRVQGRTFGVKAHEFRKVIELPRRARANAAHQFEIALQIHPGDWKDLEALLHHGWHISDPVAMAGSPDDFRRYVLGSSAEFSVAQGMYVDSRSGWFSDRTIRYLGSGKPVVIQDTGIGDHLPVGRGLLTFRTLGEAVDATERIAAEYAFHSQAARELAEEYFDSQTVISELASEVGLTLPRERATEVVEA